MKKQMFKCTFKFIRYGLWHTTLWKMLLAGTQNTLDVI